MASLLLTAPWVDASDFEQEGNSRAGHVVRNSAYGMKLEVAPLMAALLTEEQTLQGNEQVLHPPMLSSSYSKHKTKQTETHTQSKINPGIETQKDLLCLTNRSLP